MELKIERITITSFFDIPKLSKKYNRVFDLRIIAQEREVTGRFKTICIRGRGYLSADPKTHIENKSDNHVYLSAVSTEQYGIIKNVNDLDTVMSNNYRAPKDYHAENWKALREYLEGECGRASHVFGYAELRPTHAQLMAVRKSASKQMTETKKTGNGKKRTSQMTLNTRTQKQRVTQKPYKQRKGTKQSTTGGGKTKDWLEDLTRNARPVGRRISRNGNTYYEYRQNRSDTEEEIYAGTSVLDKKALKIQGQYGIIYRGGELVTPKDKRKTKKLSMKQLLEVVKSYERKIHKKPIENLLYFDECGNVIAHCVGNGGSVYIDREIEDYAVVNTHNHPYASQKPAPQSDADVKNWLRFGKIARVCSYGVTYTYAKGSKYNPEKLSYIFINNAASGLKHEFVKAQKKMYDDVGKYLHIGIKVLTKNGKIVLVKFENKYKLPNNLYERAVTQAKQMYVKRFGLEMVKVHKEFAADLKRAGIDVSFTVGAL